MARERHYYNPETGHYDLSQAEHDRIVAEESKRSEKYDLEFALMGNGFPSKSISMENKQRKALQENPNHTTMKDYKFSNPNSIPSKARKKNLAQMRGKGINIEKQVTKK